MELSSLIHNKLNPRKISRERTEKLREYLGEYGDLSGVVYNSNPDCEALVSGHQRTSEFKRQKAKIVITEKYESPQIDGTVARGFIENRSGQKYTYREVNWSKEKADAATIVANGQFGEWDSDILANSWDFDMPELRDFGVPEFVFGGDGMAGEGGIPNNALNSEAVEDDFELPGINEVKTDIVLGDLFEIGPHRLLCGDSTSKDDVEMLMDGSPINCIITDPPYGVSYVGKTKGKLEIENDALTPEQTHNLFKMSILALIDSMKPGAAIYATVPARPLQLGFMQVMADFDMLRQVMVWNKSSMVLGHSDYHYKHEPILYGWKPGASHYFTSDRTKTTVFDFEKPQRNAEHPTMKPVPLFAEFIQNSTVTGQNIEDPFGGSGTTMVASHQTGRIAYLMEIDPKYCQVIIDRMLRLDPSLEIKRNGEPYRNNPKNSVKTV